ncbi:MAG TPA: hydantoinase/oxoprolinase family protein, partial [Candidatus Binatia bacterium]|nr:hydantoinase/oxoprolinase family protein [Candidatus Binatia bacterium]
RRYGHADAKAPAEFQALHLSAFARLKQPEIARLPRAAVKPQAAQTRRVYIGNAGGWLDAGIYHRDALEPGFSAAGPAVIEEYGSTTVVWPGDRFEIGGLHEIRIQCAAK